MCVFKKENVKKNSKKVKKHILLIGKDEKYSIKKYVLLWDSNFLRKKCKNKKRKGRKHLSKLDLKIYQFRVQSYLNNSTTHLK